VVNVAISLFKGSKCGGGYKYPLNLNGITSVKAKGQSYLYEVSGC